MSNSEIIVPALGESIAEAVIAKWLKHEGDYVEKDEVIVELETDKVTQEIYAPQTGVLSKIFFPEGKEVKVGEIIAKIDHDKKSKQTGKNNNTLKNKQVELVDIRVPSLGESISEVIIGKWIKSVGEQIYKGEPLVEIETDKVTQELYAENNGLLNKIIFNEQDEVKIGAVIGTIEVNNIEKKLDNKTNDISEKEGNEKNDVLDPSIINRSGVGGKINVNDLKEFITGVSLSPSARKYINENQLEIDSLSNISEGGRVTKSDLMNMNYDNISSNTKSNITDNNSLTDQIKPLSKLRQSIATRLKQAQNTAAMLTTFNEIDMQGVINLRKKYKESFLKKHGVKLGFMSFFTKASVAVLKQIREVNAEIRKNNVVYKNRYDIGVAVGTDKGLFVPVIRSADKMTFAEIESSILEYGQLAQENKITLDHMKDGTFTISNGGVYGSMLSTPILNPPQSGILGLHNIVKRPVVIDDQITIRPIMYVALTYDHRIIDGKQAVTFLVKLKQIIENPEEMIFDL